MKQQNAEFEAKMKQIKDESEVMRQRKIAYVKKRKIVQKKHVGVKKKEIEEKTAPKEIEKKTAPSKSELS